METINFKAFNTATVISSIHELTQQRLFKVFGARVKLG